MQADFFANVVLAQSDATIIFTDAENNMKVVDAVLESGAAKCWVSIK